MKIPGILVTLFVGTFLIFSCTTTRNNVFVDADKNFNAGDYTDVRKVLAENAKGAFYTDKDTLLQYLDMGTLGYYAGDYAKSTSDLNKADQLIEDLYTKSITEAAGSLLLNDTVLSYPGEEYENLYINVLKAVGYAKSNDFDNAFVEIKRLTQKLDQMEDKYKKMADSTNDSKDAKVKAKTGPQEFSNSALAHWLSALIYRADQQNDNAQIDLNKLKDAFKDQPAVYGFPVPNVDTLLSDPSNSHLSVIAFSGNAPIKRALTYRINTSPNWVNVSKEVEGPDGKLTTTDAASFPFPGIDGQYNFKFQVPTLNLRKSPVSSVEVMVDGASVGKLSLIERMDKVAVSTFKLKEPIIYTKTLIRATLKGIAAILAKKATEQATAGLGIGGTLLTLGAGAAADAAVEFSEIADLRSSRYLPGAAWVGDFKVDAGEHAVQVNYLGKGGAVLYTKDLGKVVVNKGSALNLVNTQALDPLQVE